MKIILTAIFLIAYSIAAPAQDIATVVSEGLGKNIESATQRAAEAALTQGNRSEPLVRIQLNLS